MSSSLSSVPTLLDSLVLSSSSSSSSFSFFGKDDNSADSQTDPEPSQSDSPPCCSHLKNPTRHRLRESSQVTMISQHGSSTGIATPEATPKASYQLLKHWVEEDVGYESGREDNVQRSSMGVKNKKYQKACLNKPGSAHSRPPKSLIGLGLSGLPLSNAPNGTVDTPPSKPVLRATDPSGSPSPIIMLPALVSLPRYQSDMP